MFYNLALKLRDVFYGMLVFFNIGQHCFSVWMSLASWTHVQLCDMVLNKNSSVTKVFIGRLGNVKLQLLNNLHKYKFYVTLYIARMST